MPNVFCLNSLEVLSTFSRQCGLFMQNFVHTVIGIMIDGTVHAHKHEQTYWRLNVDN